MTRELSSELLEQDTSMSLRKLNDQYGLNNLNGLNVLN
jgi:hypothetical protein